MATYSTQNDRLKRCTIHDTRISIFNQNNMNPLSQTTRKYNNIINLSKKVIRYVASNSMTYEGCMTKSWTLLIVQAIQTTVTVL